MRLEGSLSSWNDARGFGYIESTQGGEPIFVHVSAWPKGAGRPQLQQVVSFEVELGPKGKRAKNVRRLLPRRASQQTLRSSRAPWGTATLFAIPAFVLVYLLAAVFWKPPLWAAALYVAASMVAFGVYAADKSAAARGSRRVSENTLHLLSVVGGWPGALIAQQMLRHKSAKQAFRQIFWITVVLNVLVLLMLASPWGRALLH